MSRVSLASTPIPALRPSAGLALGLLGGAAVGIGVCSLFALLLALPAIESVVGAWALPSLVLGTLAAVLVAGATSAWLVARARAQRAGWVRLVGLGVVLVVAGCVVLIPLGAAEEFGVQQPDPGRLLTFRVAFVGASAAIALTCTATAGWMFGLRRWLAHALLVAVVTASAYLVVVLVLDPLPGYHVGGGDRAMLKVATLANLIAGWIGGTLAHLLLSRR